MTNQPLNSHALPAVAECKNWTTLSYTFVVGAVALRLSAMASDCEQASLAAGIAASIGHADV
jgi:hypothetical protein